MTTESFGDPGFWAVVPAGGAGTRLWPLSRAGHPKFLLDLTGSGRTLLQATLDRLEPLAGQRVLVVTGADHRSTVLEQLPAIAPEQVVAEPAPRDSMAAIGLAAALIERRDPAAVIGSFAADHVISGQARFESVVHAAIEAARAGYVVTIGLEPTAPSTAFGYIRSGEPLPTAPAARVRSFVEKPDLATATRYLESGDYLWNAGMFVVGARVLLDELAIEHPQLAADLRAIAAQDPTGAAIDPDRWARLQRISIDHAVAEPAADRGRVAVVAADFDWDDVGDFASLAAVRRAREPGPSAAQDPSPTDAGAGLVIGTSGREVVVLGGERLAVIDTPDALLVIPLDRAQEVKAVVDRLREMGRTDLL